MKKYFFVIVAVAFFLFTISKSRVFAQSSESTYNSQQSYSSQGEVLGLKETFLSVKEFIQDPAGNLFSWLIGENGVIEGIIYGLLKVTIGLPEEIDLPASTFQDLPLGAIPMPPGDWYFTGGVLGSTGNMIASVISTPPASGVYYAYDTLKNFGGTSVYAAEGVGFSGLKPILPLWRAFRNVAYAIFALIFVVAGLMIMFRVKISPQAVLTIESALPRMIGVLILITFSYAIAGFMIDLMYIVIGLAISVLRNSGAGGPLLISKSVGQFMAMKGGFFTIMGTLFMGWPLFTLLGAVIGVVIAPLGGAVSAGIGSILFALIWVIIAIFLFFKLLIALIKTYINIILQIIFSPVLIAVGAMPSSPMGFGNWFKTLAANLLVFPAVILVMVLGTAIASFPALGSLWYPPLMGPPDLPVFDALSGVIAGGFVRGIIGIGMLFILPGIPDIVRNAFGIKDSGIGGMIGATLSPAASMGKYAGQYGIQSGVDYADKTHKAAVDLQAKGIGTGPTSSQEVAKRIGNVLKVFGRARTGE